MGLGLLAGCGRGPFFEFPQAVEQRCGAVDFLFVIDNSESMQPHQDNLRRSFGPFIDGIYSTLDDVDDFHVGVVTTDAYRDNAVECRELGALVTSVDAPGPNRTECGPFAEGERYMTQKDDLAQAFNCAANVGTDGSRDEEPMNAMRRAIAGQSWSWYPQCNHGFVRDDALLVTVIITDEGDGEESQVRDEPQPDDWFRTVVETKGTQQNAVVVSLVNGVTPECPIQNDAFDGTKIAAFTEMFDQGYVGGICEPDYGEIFARAVGGIDEACSTFVVDLPTRSD